MAFDAEKLTLDIRSAATIILGKDVSAIEGFDIKLTGKIARQAANAANTIKTARITKETKDFLLDGIRSTIKAFVDALQGVDAFTAGKVSYAITYVVFKTISNETGEEIKA